MRGMILAAGYGERMRPLTLERPKPVLPVANRPLILYAVDLLRGAGVADVIVNLHHLGDQVHALLGTGSRWGVRVSCSMEPRILGTGGGVRRAWNFLTGDGADDAPFVVANADTILRTDLSAAIEFHHRTGAVATMVVAPRADMKRYGAVRFDAEGQVLDIAGLAGSAEPGAEAVFAGVHVLSPRVLRAMPKRDVFCIVREVLVPLVRAGERVVAFPAKGTWIDAGAPADYLAANENVLSAAIADPGGPLGSLLAETREVSPSVFVAVTATIAADVRFAGPVLVGGGATIGPGATLGPRVVVGEGATVGAGARLADTVVWDGAGVPDGTDAARAVVTGSGVFRVEG
jgi:NDP-sugar pyrophosphorylase family protein